jgi:hypothetical protein
MYSVEHPRLMGCAVNFLLSRLSSGVIVPVKQHEIIGCQSISSNLRDGGGRYIYTTLMALICAKQSVSPNIYLLNAGLGSKLHPARLLPSPVLCESLFFGSSHGRRKPHISNILEITIDLWRPPFIPADMSTLEAIQRGACATESWLVPLLGLIRTAV